MKKNVSQTLAVLALFTIAMASRIFTAFDASHIPQWLQNFSPLAAICLCGAVFLPRKLAIFLPLSIIVISDIVLNMHYHKPLLCVEMLSRYPALALVIAMGWAIRKHGHMLMVIPASIAGSLAFYFITNTASWISDAAYAKTFAGLMQALTTGLPGLPSTWSFFRSTFISDLLFTTLFVLCMVVTANRTPRHAAANAQPAVSS